MPAGTLPGASSSLSLSPTTNGASTGLCLRFLLWKVDQQPQIEACTYSPTLTSFPATTSSPASSKFIENIDASESESDARFGKGL